MKKLIIFIFLFFLVKNAFSETVILKSGKSIDGKIISRSDRYINLDIGDFVVTYYLDEIQTIKPDKAEAPFKTAKIVYEGFAEMIDNSGNVVTSQKTEQTTYIDTVNNLRRDEEKTITNMPGSIAPLKQEITKIFKADKIYTIEPDKKTATFFDIGSDDMQFWQDMSFDEKFLSGEEKVLDRICQIYDYKSMKLWVWKGVILKKELHSDITRQGQTAISIEENIDIALSKFDLPESVVLQSMDEQLVEMVKDMSDLMKVDKDAPTGIFDFALAGMGNADAEEKIIDSIISEELLSEQEKNEAMINIKEMLAEQKTVYDSHRNEKGEIDMEGVITDFGQKRDEANELAAAAAMLTIFSAEVMYKQTYNRYATLEELGKTDPPFIDATLARGKKQGYNYIFSSQGNNSFFVVATPESSKSNIFYIDENGLLCKSIVVDNVKPTEHAGGTCPAGFSEHNTDTKH